MQQPVGCLAYLPAAMVFQRVVPPAEMREIRCAREAAICCGERVVEVAAMQGSTAARKPAVRVSRAEETAHLLARTVSVDADDLAGRRMLGDDLLGRHRQRAASLRRD